MFVDTNNFQSLPPPQGVKLGYLPYIIFEIQVVEIISFSTLNLNLNST